MSISERIPGVRIVNRGANTIKKKAPEIETALGSAGFIYMGAATLNPDGAAVSLSKPLPMDLRTIQTRVSRFEMPEHVPLETDQAVFALIMIFWGARALHGIKDIRHRRHLARYPIKGL